MLTVLDVERRGVWGLTVRDFQRRDGEGLVVRIPAQAVTPLLMRAVAEVGVWSDVLVSREGRRYHASPDFRFN